MKQILLYSRSSALLFTLLILSQCQFNAGKQTSEEIHTKYDKQLTDLANELNKQCPRMVDKETQWDNSVFLAEPYLFQYNYTLINRNRTEIDTAAMMNYMTPILVNNARTNPDMKEFLASKVNLGYYYKDKNGVHLFRIIVTPRQYEQESKKD